MVPQLSDKLAHEEYEFTNGWFRNNIAVWNNWIPQLKPRRILEIGSFEGQSTCYLIENATKWHDVELHCVDTWQGGIEHQKAGLQMSDVEKRFQKNTKIAQRKALKEVTLQCHKSYSHEALAKYLASGQYGYFDLVYIDGSHQAPDVLTDATMAFPLLRVGGLLVFDDYSWHMEKSGHQDLINMPKLAIDSFTSIFQRKIRMLNYPMRQVYLVKESI